MDNAMFDVTQHCYTQSSCSLSKPILNTKRKLIAGNTFKCDINKNNIIIGHILLAKINS